MIGLICFRVCSSPMTLTLLAFPVLCLFCMLLFRFLVSWVLRLSFRFLRGCFVWVGFVSFVCFVGGEAVRRWAVDACMACECCEEACGRGCEGCGDTWLVRCGSATSAGRADGWVVACGPASGGDACLRRGCLVPWADRHPVHPMCGLVRYRVYEGELSVGDALLGSSVRCVGEVRSVYVLDGRPWVETVSQSHHRSAQAALQVMLRELTGWDAQIS